MIKAKKIYKSVLKNQKQKKQKNKKETHRSLSYIKDN